MKKTTKMYQSKQHPDKFITVDLTTYDDRAKTYIADYPDGKSIVINNVTLTRWWQEVESMSAVSNEAEVSADNTTEDTIEQPSDATTVAVPKKERKKKSEMTKREKKAVKRAKAKSKAAVVAIETRNAFRQTLTDTLIAKGFEPFEYAMKDVLLFRINGKTVMRVHFNRKNLKYFVRASILADGVKHLTYDYFLDAVLQRDYTDDTITDIVDTLKCYL